MSRHKFLDPELVLADLKPFQQRTALHAFDRLVHGHSGRFLVADEVGLGKTLVARAVVAQMIEHLAEAGTARIDVVYICSNMAIARQNLRKLNPTTKTEHEHRVRLTMLPVEMGALEDGSPEDPALNFIALTPQTSLSMGNRTGAWRERALMHWLITDLYPDLAHRRGLFRVFGAGLRGPMTVVGQKAARRFADFREYHALTPGYPAHFAAAVGSADHAARVAGRESLRQRLELLDAAFADARRKPSPEMQGERKRVIGELRNLVAGTAVALLQPDLVILDEFQRFRDLLGDPEKDPVAELAQALMSHEDEGTGNIAKVLLLSATPYKSLSLRSDEEDGDHYGDLLETIRFLADDEDTMTRVARGFRAMQRGLLAARAGGISEAAAACESLAQELGQLMSRTERLAVTPDRDGMLTIEQPRLSIQAEDVRGYLGEAAVSAHADSYEVIELWKSAPWLMSFMEGYQLKSFVEELEDAGDATMLQLLASPDVSLPAPDVDDFGPLHPPNARYRALRERVLGSGQQQLAWLPPSLPYYRADGPFDTDAARRFTKHLVFSSWGVVPKAVSTLLSYDAERSMRRPDAVARGYQGKDSRKFELRLEGDEARGMTTLALLIPSAALAALGDPLRAGGGGTGQTGGGTPHVRAVQEIVRNRVAEALQTLPDGPDAGAEDVGWYAVAPLLLDRAEHQGSLEGWMGEPGTWWRCWATEKGSDDGSRQLRTHIDHLHAILSGAEDLGRRPADLGDVLTDLAIASPANAALRALSRQEHGLDPHDQRIRHRASQIAWSFRSLFNGPEIQDLITTLHEDLPYWRAALTYCVDGHLQAVLDEYVHTFADWRGFVTRDPLALHEELARTLDSVLALRTSTHVVHSWDTVDGQGVRREPDLRLRAHYAVPYGTRRLNDDAGLQRSVAVGDAFNSPFWPFVVVSTSLGQEGLDFHLYAHALVHWNLPSNPVDLEQREGRVHRYKGHAVRKNVAADFGAQILDSGSSQDVWAEVFEQAVAARGDADGLIPWWVYPGEASIQRVLLNPPLSRETGRYAALERALGRYRLAIGAPRQDELLSFLSDLEPDVASEAIEKLRIDLSPPSAPAGARTEGGPT